MKEMETDRPILVGALLVGGALLSIGAAAGYVIATKPEYAQVIFAEPVTRAVTVAEQQCRGVQVKKRKQDKDAHRVAGTVIGGMAGGVIAHQVGGTGRKAASAAGAADGTSEGNHRAQKKVQARSAIAANERRCRIVNRTEQKVIAYDVRYRLDGKLGKVRMDHAPGARIPVKNGQLVLSPEPAKEQAVKG